jgi:hypothetical protein
MHSVRSTHTSETDSTPIPDSAWMHVKFLRTHSRSHVVHCSPYPTPQQYTDPVQAGLTVKWVEVAPRLRRKMKQNANHQLHFHVDALTPAGAAPALSFSLPAQRTQARKTVTDDFLSTFTWETTHF